jgi:hypothetical protein
MRCWLLAATLALPACNDGGVLLLRADPDVPWGEVDVSACGFEDGDLGGFGWPGVSYRESEDGAKTAIVTEGDGFSALRGEELVPFHGDRAVLLRPNDAGDTTSVAVIRTNPFVPRAPFLNIDQMSEVDERGIALEAWILRADSGEVDEVVPLAVETGGFVPELLPEHEAIPGAPWITWDSFNPGVFVRNQLDLTAWAELALGIQVEFRQRTLIQDNGFFTLLDNLCNGEPP